MLRASQTPKFPRNSLSRRIARMKLKPALEQRIGEGSFCVADVGFSFFKPDIKRSACEQRVPVHRSVL